MFYTSVTEPTVDNPAGVVPDHRATEEALAASGLRWTSLRNNLYSEFQLPTLQQASASGQLVTNAGAGLTAYVTRTDCAAAAAAALLLPDPAQIYDITGPAGVSTQDLAALAGTLGGNPVEVVDVTDEEFVAGLVSAGLPEPVAQLLCVLRYGDPRRLHGADQHRRRRPHRPAADPAGRPGSLTPDSVAATDACR